MLAIMASSIQNGLLKNELQQDIIFYRKEYYVKDLESLLINFLVHRLLLKE